MKEPEEQSNNGGERRLRVREKSKKVMSALSSLRQLSKSSIFYWSYGMAEKKCRIFAKKFIDESSTKK
jgi:hypothetical protein